MFAANKITKSIFLPIVFFQLTLGQSLLSADVEITSQERTIEQINSFLSSGEPSDIPFVDYMEQFQKQETQPLKLFDLSTYTGKQVYVGYGTFDAGQKYCKYVEQPGLSPTTNAADVIETYFTNNSSFNKHTYAVSINKMSLSQCQNLVDHFGGIIATPTSLAESGFLSSRYFQQDKWLGIERTDCSTPYFNQEGKDQEYFNWSSAISGECDATKLFTYQNSYGKWGITNGTEQHYCVMEVDAQDIHRPVKICAPWWRVEREYMKEAQNDWGGVNINRINQADIPEMMSVCTAYDANNTAYNNAVNSANRRVTCTTYYDATIAQGCMQDTLQPICKVNECAGYIQNACHKVEELTPLKDYTKTQVVIDDVLTWIKGKDRIRTQVYDCPPSPPSLNTCTEKSEVLIYPQECPGSQCSQLKSCLYTAMEKEAKDLCHTTYTCNKIYGNPDLPVLDASGKLTQLKGICPDGTELLFDLNIQNKIDKKCLEYEMYTTEKEVSQKCILERPYADYTVDVSLTADDVYMSNPDCIRLNNLFDSVPIQEITFDYENKGFAKTVIKKSYINDTQAVNVNTGSDNIIEFGNMANSGTLSVPSTTTSGTLSCTISDAWVTKVSNILLAGATSITSNTYEASSNPSKMKIRFDGVADLAACTSLQGTYGVASEYNDLTKVCNVFYNKATEDTKFQMIKDLEPTLFLTEVPVSKTTCINYAECIGAAYNESDFSSGSAICSLSAGEGYSAPESAPSVTNATFDNSCLPVESNGAYPSQLDGTEDVFSIQESVSGVFGYYSNYTTPDYKHNIVTVGGNEVYPLKPIPVIDDPLIYNGAFRQDSILTKSPNIVAGAIAGAGAIGAVGLIEAVVIAYLVAAIFGKKKKYNEQWAYWAIFKLVPVSRYVDNVYGYDFRIMSVDASGNRIIYGGKDSNSMPIVGGGGQYYKLIYAEFGKDPRPGGFSGSMVSFTGTLEPGDFIRTLQNWLNYKKHMFICMGWQDADIPIAPVEQGVVVGYPKCKWYEFSCDKRNRSPNPMSYKKDPLYKPMTNQYAGALNGVTIVVPYAGDYEVKAYDKHNNLLGDVIIYEDNFLDAAAGKASYAHVMFALNMDIAAGVTDGTSSGACRYDLMAEWGGGVSGIYYENDFTGMYHGCSKSNDAYVSDHSAVKLTIMSLKTNRPFVIELEKPLPWANRVFVVTLNEKEIRKYRCFDDFGDCAESSYITEGE